jgi:hypothetical protein
MLKKSRMSKKNNIQTNKLNDDQTDWRAILLYRLNLSLTDDLKEAIINPVTSVQKPNEVG